MASGTNYSQEYGQAEKAYLESDFAQAAEIIDHLAEEFPKDPNVLLLRGHIYCYGFQNYELARNQYEQVLELSQEQDLLDFAHSGLEQLEQLEQQSESSDLGFDEGNFEMTQVFGDSNEEIDEAEDSIGIDFPEEELAAEFESDDFDFGGDYDEDSDESSSADIDNPFAEDEEVNSEDLAATNYSDGSEDPFASFDSEEPLMAEEPYPAASGGIHNSSTFMVDDEANEPDLPDYTDEDLAVEPNDYSNDYDDSSELEIDTILTEPFNMADNEEYDSELEEAADREGLDYQDELEFDEIDSSFFDLEELEQGLPDTGLFNVVEESSNLNSNASNNINLAEDLSADSSIAPPDEIAISQGSTTSVTSFAPNKEEPQVEVSHGALSGFINAPMDKKQLVTAGITGLVSAIAVLGIGFASSTVLNRDSETDLQQNAINSLIVSLVAGVTSFGTAAALGSITAKHITKASQNLQTQFDDVYQGNLNAKATVYAQDEFGQLATGFNRMTRVILTTTQEAQRRAEETEQAKEDLQRQVIRLLDDVEGAARGDLTVQATVTADVLGAVADAFNLTIQSLREIVRQVKEAAEQVNKGSTDSELFARNQSSEALRMAEELAVTLNSVQMMTESIERVADNAREAEEVARSSSVTALKGGKAVERTVSGIFQIRETVSETARKVKRLAEASQEISKIVLLISQIAERTNQLALNASIQAAKAGEAGRGFAVVADEVRQLADRSAKSLKEIEQIVLQIQSETGSVMTAMEEGIQEVIDVTERAEQAKTALEDIIQVSNRIDTLVRSITADTVEQRENSRAVAQVMQSVELTAQATSQESQRVGGALQNLVGIARGLLSSVERFRIDKGEE